MTRSTVPLLLALVFCAPPARGHEAWLAPSRYQAAAGESLRVGAFVGTGFRGEARPYAARRVERFLARGGVPLDLARGTTDGATTWARWTAGDDDGTLVAYASHFIPIELPAAEFERYLALEGLDAVARARARSGRRDTPGRERYLRSSKAWIAGATPSNRSAARATTALGLPLEIVPLDEPGAGDRLALRVDFEGRPLAGALVRAWRQDLGRGFTPVNAAARDSVGPRPETRTDERGRATLPIDAHGEWLIGVVHMIPSRDDEVAHWESTWASLTFARTPK